MTYTISQFANNTTPSLSDLDQNFNAFGVLAPIPCTIAGTNALVFTQNGAGQAASIALVAYQNQVQVCGVAAATNTGAATAAVGSLGALSIYKDTLAGPVALVGGEIVSGNSITLRYDSTLNGGNGGWHLIAGAQDVGNTITPALVRASTGIQIGATTTPTLTGLLSATATVAHTALVPGAGQDQTFTMSGLSVTDALLTGFPLPVSTGLVYSAYIAAAGTVAVRVNNTAPASTITPGTVTLQVKALRTT